MEKVDEKELFEILQKHHAPFDNEILYWESVEMHCSYQDIPIKFEQFKNDSMWKQEYEKFTQLKTALEEFFITKEKGNEEIKK